MGHFDAKKTAEGSTDVGDSVRRPVIDIQKNTYLSKHFSSYLTRAVGEIFKDAESEGLYAVHLPLQFIKSVMVRSKVHSVTV
jgi:hypothetical protein